jgi:hypothetical protein
VLPNHIVAPITVVRLGSCSHLHGFIPCAGGIWRGQQLPRGKIAKSIVRAIFPLCSSALNPFPTLHPIYSDAVRSDGDGGGGGARFGREGCGVRAKGLGGATAAPELWSCGLTDLSQSRMTRGDQLALHLDPSPSGVGLLQWRRARKASAAQAPKGCRRWGGKAPAPTQMWKASQERSCG